MPQDPPSIAALEARNRTCTACPLRAGCLQVVVSDGDPQAPLVIVGEAPGSEEDQAGLPFVGRSGQLLDQILAAVNLGRQDAYFTNVIKCRTPADRAPTPTEIAVCAGLWLEPQLALLRPQVILSLGNTATQYLLQSNVGITQLRGQWHQYRQRGGLYQAYLLPVFHPAYLLRQDTRAVGGPKSLTWHDIQAMKAVLQGKIPDPVQDPSKAAQGPLF